jgi:aspartate racemase
MRDASGTDGSLRVPGLLGGAGPGATAALYLDITERCRQANLPRRPAVLIASLEIDLALEGRLLRDGIGIEGYRDALLRAGQALAAAGADFLAIPCNTLHLLLPDLAGAVPIPVVSIVEAVAGEVEARGCRTVGLLATSQTVRSGLYAAGLASRGIEVVTIDPASQARLDAQIGREVAAPGQSVDPELGTAILTEFTARGVCAIVAGCTELKALLAGWSAPMPVIDSLDALGGAVVREMLAGSDR